MEEEMYVRTSFTPIRMLAGQKEPVALNVEIRNKSKTSKKHATSMGPIQPKGATPWGYLTPELSGGAGPAPQQKQTTGHGAPF